MDCLQLYFEGLLPCSPVGAHAGVALVLDAARPGADHVGDQPAAVLLVQVQVAVLVLVHRVPAAQAAQ